MDSNIFCSLAAMTAEQRQRHSQLGERLFGRMQAVRELSDGYAMLFPVDTLPDMASFITLERICCPFLNFRITISADSEVIELALTGNEDVKAFLRSEFGSAFEAK